MPRAKSHRRAQAAKRRIAERQSWTPGPPIPEFVARMYNVFLKCFIKMYPFARHVLTFFTMVNVVTGRGTGYRHRVRRWRTSELTHRPIKFVTPAQRSDQQVFVFFI